MIKAPLKVGFQVEVPLQGSIGIAVVDLGSPSFKSSGWVIVRGGEGMEGFLWILAKKSCK